jgi:hypothetical protein
MLQYRRSGGGNMKSEFLILNEEMKEIINDIKDDIEEVTKHLIECEGMDEMAENTSGISSKLDRLKWITNYVERLYKDFDK